MDHESVLEYIEKNIDERYFRQEILNVFDDGDIVNEADDRGLLDPYINDITGVGNIELIEEYERRGLTKELSSMVETYIRLGNRKEALRLIIKEFPDLTYHEDFLLG